MMSKIENAIVELVKNEITDIDDLESKLDDLDSKVEALDSRMDYYDVDKDALNDEIRCMSKRMDDYEVDLSILEKDIKQRIVKNIMDSFVGMSFMAELSLTKSKGDQNAKQDSGENKEAPVVG